jgi:predicted RNA polymerase sigma factor
VHDEAPAASVTDWPQILALYEVLSQVAPGPVTLSRAVALAMVHTARRPGSPCSASSTRTTG